MKNEKRKSDTAWLNLYGAAEYLSLSKETMYKLVSSKMIPTHRIGKLYRFNRLEIDKWIISGKSRHAGKTSKRTTSLTKLKRA